jgi:hypothetical protein
MGALIGFIGTFAARIFADKVLGWLAIKAVLSTLFIVIVPILLNNIMYDIMEIVFNFASSKTGEVQSLNGAMSFSGFMGWLLDVFQVPAAFSVIIGALALRVTLKMIPFVKI